MLEYSLFFVFFIFPFALAFARNTVGTLYTPEDALNQLGPVNGSISISTDVLKFLSTLTTNYLMFRLVNGNLTILGDSREVIYPSNADISPDDKFIYFSISMVQKLIEEGDQKDTFIEERNGTMTITNGNTILDSGMWCPPDCPPD